MKLLLRPVWKWICGDLGWVALLGLAVAGAAIYVHVRQVTSDRDQLLAWAQRTCAGAGQGFDASTLIVTDAKGKQSAGSYKRGVLCEQRVGYLAKFRADTADASAGVLAQAATDHEKRASADRTASAANGQAQRAAEKEMETANGNIQDDRVGDDWFGALGNLAGMR
jgi:hypothetical protein